METTTPRFQVQIANRIGTLNGRTCAVGTDWLAVDRGSTRRQCSIILKSRDEDVVRALVAQRNAEEVR